MLFSLLSRARAHPVCVFDVSAPPHTAHTPSDTNTNCQELYAAFERLNLDGDSDSNYENLGRAICPFLSSTSTASPAPSRRADGMSDHLISLGRTAKSFCDLNGPFLPFCVSLIFQAPPPHTLPILVPLEGADMDALVDALENLGIDPPPSTSADLTFTGTDSVTLDSTKRVDKKGDLLQSTDLAGSSLNVNIQEAAVQSLRVALKEADGISETNHVMNGCSGTPSYNSPHTPMASTNAAILYRELGLNEYGTNNTSSNLPFPSADELEEDPVIQDSEDPTLQNDDDDMSCGSLVDSTDWKLYAIGASDTSGRELRGMQHWDECEFMSIRAGLADPWGALMDDDDVDDLL